MDGKRIDKVLVTPVEASAALASDSKGDGNSI
jgi:hypothetical protein